MSSQDSKDNLKNLSPVTEDKKKKKTSPLKLAPIPTTSPWKSASPESTTVLPVEELKDISKASKPNKNSAGSIKLTSNTKWTPITPSVIISGSKSSNSNSGKNAKNSKSNKTMKKHSKNNKSFGEKLPHGQPSASSEAHKALNVEPKSFDGDVTLNRYSSSEISAGGKNEKTTNGKNSSNGRQSKNYHNKSGKARHNNEYHGFGYNRTVRHGNSFHQSRSGDTPSTSHLLNNNFGSAYNQKSHFNPQQYYNNYNYQQLQTSYYYSMEPIFKSIENIKNQIEFYFSEENLKNDEFLRSKFSKTNDGFIPMSLIGKFYRMVNLSLGGDLNLILASMKEVLNNKETNHLEIAFGSIEGTQTKTPFQFNPLENYFIRRTNWSDYTTGTDTDESDESEKYTIESILEVGDLDNYSYMGYSSFPSTSVNDKRSQTHDESEVNREFEQNLQIND
ncbi:Slf1p [Saccharomyces cerevisiae x Saccharomyces kudriavzevii VIN7]|uniref:Slf1p n=1 Tax=Saccharomyces cerevisiae x Saccharomyces kudriavzevii (strain VIN7) TaxID=1095631 RepID=H0GTI7_SACCK|nr:Slf1p [Saccharomyces cerevisiae x Saccharomyces kudriavzevii VIN7]